MLPPQTQRDLHFTYLAYTPAPRCTTEKHGITNKVQTKLQKLNLVVTQSRLLIFNIPKMVTQIMNVTNPQLPGDAGLDQSKFDVTNEKAKISLDDQDISNIYSVPLSTRSAPSSFPYQAAARTRSHRFSLLAAGLLSARRTSRRSCRPPSHLLLLLLALTS